MGVTVHLPARHMLHVLLSVIVMSACVSQATVEMDSRMVQGAKVIELLGLVRIYCTDCRY